MLEQVLTLYLLLSVKLLQKTSKGGWKGLADKDTGISDYYIDKPNMNNIVKTKTI